MPVTIDEYRCKLIDKFLFAGSQHEIQSFIYTAIKELKEHKMQPYIIKRFLDTTANTLQEFNSCDCNSQQWANLKISITLLNQFKTSISHVAVKGNRKYNYIK
ncbi:MAG: hypothetical protein ABIO76_09565 [Ginsengibacter sp.]